MNIEEFKNKIDSRELWGNNSKEAFIAAYKWADIANSETKIKCQWSWDCGFKLDYDGELCNINSRFYPPYKSHENYNKWHGNISIYINDDEISKKEIEADTLDELRFEAEKYVLDIESKIRESIKSIFS